eukprot:14844388-Heterocapsa_arctica.AAC.1
MKGARREKPNERPQGSENTVRVVHTRGWTAPPTKCSKNPGGYAAQRPRLLGRGPSSSLQPRSLAILPPRTWDVL